MVVLHKLHNGTKIPILHTVEIIDWYTGGPKPEVLKKAMKKILITRKLMKSSEEYASKIFDVKLNKEDKLLTKDELISKSSDCDGILSSITDKLDAISISKLSIKLKLFLILQLVLEILILMQQKKEILSLQILLMF